VSKLKIHVGDSLETIDARVKDAVRRDRKGERVREHRLTFDAFETLAKVLTPRRLDCCVTCTSIPRPPFARWPRRWGGTTGASMTMSRPWPAPACSSGPTKERR